MESLDGFHLDHVGAEEAQLARVGSCSDPIFQTILASFGKQSSLDAYHVFTAEKFDMFCFLHIDFGLAEIVRQNQSKKPFTHLKTKILRPSEFGELIHLRPIGTSVLSFEDSSFPVRPDLYWERQTRTRPKKGA
jgi:hypothetical protein